ncbi:MAG: RhuM family protein [Dehalococcoidales bacterium]|nr:RhuM family protein [Dehalococcoidales bacterium]
MNDVQIKIAELETNGWTLAAIATELDLTVNAIEKWKAGDRYPANSKAILLLLDSLAQKKRIPKQKRYAPDNRQSKTDEVGDVDMSDEGNLPVIFQSDSGEIKLRVDPDRETIWATQLQMATIFGVDRSVITKHVANIFSDQELDELNNVQKMHIVGSKQLVNIYTLDVILSVGYRVNSKTATKFRQWATQKLSEYIRDGAVLDEERLTNNPALQKKLADKIRRIRTSEVSLYQKVRDVFKESASDYNPESQTAKTFFALAQDKFHFAVTGKTASEIKIDRADPLKHNMGLVTVKGKTPTMTEADVAKNYLSPDELRALENISEQFLLFAESKAFRGHKMTMEEISFKLNTLLTANDYQVLYEYKQYLRQKADDHVRKVFDTYQRQLKAPDRKQLE